MANAGDGIGPTNRTRNGVISNWLPKLEIGWRQHFALIDLLYKKNQVKQITGGGEIRWRVETAAPGLKKFIQDQPLSFARTGGYTNARLGWGAYRNDDVVSPEEKAAAQGKWSMMDLVPEVMDRLSNRSFAELTLECYKDGANASQDGGIDGLLSMFAYTSGSQTSTHEYATVLAATYAGLSTAYGTVGGVTGQQSGPAAGATAAEQMQWNIWSPSVANVTATVNSVLRSWADNCDQIISALIRRLVFSSSPEDQADCGILTEEAHRLLLEKMRTTHRVMLQESYLATKYGFKPIGSFNFEGIQFWWDRACPTTDSSSKVLRGFVLNSSRLALRYRDPKITGSKAAPKGNQLFRFLDALDLYGGLNDVYILVSSLQMVAESPKYHGMMSEIS